MDTAEVTQSEELFAADEMIDENAEEGELTIHYLLDYITSALLSTIRYSIKTETCTKNLISWILCLLQAHIKNLHRQLKFDLSW